MRQRTMHRFSFYVTQRTAVGHAHIVGFVAAGASGRGYPSRIVPDGVHWRIFAARRDGRTGEILSFRPLLYVRRRRHHIPTPPPPLPPHPRAADSESNGMARTCVNMVLKKRAKQGFAPRHTCSDAI